MVQDYIQRKKKKKKEEREEKEGEEEEENHALMLGPHHISILARVILCKLTKRDRKNST